MSLVGGEELVPKMSGTRSPLDTGRATHKSQVQMFAARRRNGLANLRS